MDIKRAGSQPSSKGPAEYFTGTVRIDPLFQAPTPSTGWNRSATSSTTAADSGPAETKGIGYKIMRIINIGVALFLAACFGVTARAQRMEISPRQSRPAARGAAETFTGTVSVTP